VIELTIWSDRQAHIGQDQNNLVFVSGEWKDPIPKIPMMIGCRLFWRLQDGSGTTAIDSSGKGEHGTLDDFTYTKSNGIYMAESSNATAEITVADSANLSALDPLGLLSITQTTYAAANYRIIAKQIAAPNGDIQLQNRGNAGTMRVIIFNVNNNVDIANCISTTGELEGLSVSWTSDDNANFDIATGQLASQLPLTGASAAHDGNQPFEAGDLGNTNHPSKFAFIQYCNAYFNYNQLLGYNNMGVTP